MKSLLNAADIGFLVFHTLLILFNIFGWIWKDTRRINLFILLLTGASWFILGLFYGIGYCPLTDWHWQVLSELGRPPETTSYMAFLIDRLFGINLSRTIVDTGTVVGYFAALACSIIVNIRDARRKR